MEGPERQLSVAVDARPARKCPGAYFLEGSATTNSLSLCPYMRGRSCQYFSGRSTVQLAFTIEFRLAHSFARAARRFVESPLGYAREWSAGRASPRATPSNRKCLSLVYTSCPRLCPVPLLLCKPKLCVRVHASRTRRKERGSAASRQRSLIPASGTWNRTALCFSS